MFVLPWYLDLKFCSICLFYSKKDGDDLCYTNKKPGLQGLKAGLHIKFVCQEFIDKRNSSLVLVFSKRSFTKFMASTEFMSAIYLRSIHMRSSV